MLMCKRVVLKPKRNAKIQWEICRMPNSVYSLLKTNICKAQKLHYVNNQAADDFVEQPIWYLPKLNFNNKPIKFKFTVSPIVRMWSRPMLHEARIIHVVFFWPIINYCYDEFFLSHVNHWIDKLVRRIAIMKSGLFWNMCHTCCSTHGSSVSNY